MLNVVPYSEEYEKAVLVSVMTDPKILDKISGILSPSDFYKNHHKEIYAAIVDLGSDYIDSLTVQAQLAEKTKDYFITLVQDSDKILPSLSNTVFYAEEIKNRSKLRDGIDLGQRIIATCYQPSEGAEDILRELEQYFSEFINKRVQENKQESTKELFIEFMSHLGERVRETGGIKTSLIDLDLILHRLEGITILAARPGMGKTSLALNMARNIAKDGHNVLFFSLEQAKDQIFERLLSAEAEVSLEEIRTGAFMADVMTKASVEAGRTSLLPIIDKMHIDDTPNVNAAYVASVARQKRFEWGSIGAIFVDYLHIMALPDGNKVDTLGDAVKALRGLGKELECPVVLLSQLSRQQDSDERSSIKRRPRLTDLRSSGEIEQSADAVLFIYRDSYYSEPGLAPDIDIAELILAKHRNGRQGTINVRWLPAFTKFKNI